MSQTFTIALPHTYDRNVSRRVHLVATCLLFASIIYILGVTVLPPHGMRLGDAVDVFTAGAVPGVLVTLLLWLARPDTFDRRLRQMLIGVSLFASVLTALAPSIVAEL